MGGCDYSSILWGLEMCAWDKKFLKKTTKVLFKLQKIEDKNSNYVNQPSNSLYRIYRLWRPQTSVEFEQRFEILKSLSTELPEEIWNLFLRLILDHSEIGDDNYRSKYRDFNFTSPKTLQRQKIAHHIDKICGEILNQLKESPEKWPMAFEAIFKMPVKNKHQFFDELLKINLSSINEKVKMEICLMLKISSLIIRSFQMRPGA